MRRFLVKFVLVSLCALLAMPAFSQGSPSRPPQDDTELQKLNEVMAFLRGRNARGYAVTSPDGIDDARYVEVGGIQQWITIRDVNDWIDGQVLSAERLVPQTSTLEAKALGGDFSLLVFVIQGAEDFTTPATLARKFVDSIRAPRKAFVSIEGGGHFAVFMKSDVFLNELVSRVLPLAKRH